MIMSVGSVVGRQAQAAQPSSSQVWYDDIPGSICGPEDGPWPRAFTRLGTSEAWAKLAQASDPQSMSYDVRGRWCADAVNFQPFPGTRSQDRYAMQRLDIGGRTWMFTAVFDGESWQRQFAWDGSDGSSVFSSQDISVTRLWNMRRITCPS
jgi:pyruvate dehydrogenase phosphatase